MSESPAGRIEPPSGYGRPPADRVLALAAGVAICLLGSAVVLPWIHWGFSTQDSGDIGSSVSLWDIMSAGTAADFGANWMQIVAAGMAAAAVGSLAELVQRPVTRAPRWLAVAGFGMVVGASCLGLVAGVRAFSGSTSFQLSDSFTANLGLGFWVAVGLAAVGTIVSLIRLTEPPNPARQPLPFAPSPWGPLPGVLPAGYYPTGTDSSEYLERGEIPPGFVPPSYKPAVYPSPGLVTTAYTWPSYPGSGSGPSVASVLGDPTQTSSDPGSVTAVAPAPGHLIVLEAGSSKILTVQSGMRLLVGRDPDAEIRVSDRRVSERHATIERRGDEWAVQDVDAMNPTRLIDGWGTKRQVRGETTISSGQLVVGDVLITLYANQP